MQTINNINCINEIKQIEKSLQEIEKVFNYFNDEEDRRPQEIRSQLMNVLAKAEKSLLIDCYTISEEMFKSFKYKLLKSDNEYINVYLKKNLKIQNKFEQICIIFKKYNLNYQHLDKKCFKNYTKMIQERHNYAHENKYTLKLVDYKTIINELYLLEFQYRMFLDKKDLTCINYILSCQKFDTEQHFKVKFDEIVKNVDLIRCCFENENLFLICEIKKLPSRFDLSNFNKMIELITQSFI